MKEYPMSCNTEMVKAILEGRKTQTRRICKDQSPQKYWYAENIKIWPDGKDLYTGWVKDIKNLAIGIPSKCPYGQVGDRLLVKEEKMSTIGGFRKHRVAFDTDITLEITDVRVERLQEIVHKTCRGEMFETGGAWAEGIRCPNPTAGFILLWDSIHKKEHRWKDNPWVWVRSFRVI